MGAIWTHIRSTLWGQEYRTGLLTSEGSGIELRTVTTIPSWPSLDFGGATGNYEGSCAILASFLEGCKDAGLPDSDYQQLVAALSDVSRKNGKVLIDVEQFTGMEEEAADLLRTVGIATTQDRRASQPQKMSSRLHMTQELMLELFKERIMEEGCLMHKIQSACIRRAAKGEQVVTKVGGEVTSDIVVMDDTSWVVRAPTIHQEEYVLSKEKFEANWLFDEPQELPRSTHGLMIEHGYKRYAPRPGKMKWMYKIKQEDIDILPSLVFKAQWGALQPILLDDYLVMPYPEVNASEIYLMPADAVKNSYTQLEKQLGSGNEEIKKALPSLGSLYFDCRTRGNVQLDTSTLISAFMEPFDLLYRYQIDAIVFGGWITAMADQYNKNPYHDWKHAFDVFQFTYGAFTDGGAHKYFHYQDLLALLLSAIGHDVGHGGYTNAFLISSSDTLAITYNDKSPLENMHASIFFQTLRKPGLNFMYSISKSNVKIFRSKVVDAILATDMSHHFQMVDTFSVRVSQAKQGSPFVEGSDLVDREASDQQLLLQAFMHMADLGHCCRAFEIHKFGVVRLEDEFFQQGDKERDLGLPIMPMMDRTKDSAAAGQSFFLNKLVLPLLDSYAFFMQGARAQKLLANIKENSLTWENWLEKHGKSTTARKMLELEGFDFESVTTAETKEQNFKW